MRNIFSPILRAYLSSVVSNSRSSHYYLQLLLTPHAEYSGRYRNRTLAVKPATDFKSVCSPLNATFQYDLRRAMDSPTAEVMVRAAAGREPFVHFREHSLAVCCNKPIVACSPLYSEADSNCYYTGFNAVVSSNWTIAVFSFKHVGQARFELARLARGGRFTVCFLHQFGYCPMISYQ